MNIEDYWLQTQLRNQSVQPQPNPALVAASQQQMPQQSTENPLASGSQSAIGAVRQSLQAEKPKSFGGQLLDTLGRTMSNVGIAGLRGSNIGVEQELGKIMETPQEREQRTMKENSGIMKHLYDRALDEANYIIKQQELGETKRYHNIVAGRYSKAGSNKTGNVLQSIPGLDFSQYPNITSKSVLNQYEKSLQANNVAGRMLSDIEKDFNELKELTKDNWVEPSGSMIPYAEEIKDRISNATQGSKSGWLEKNRRESLLRGRLKSKFGRLVPLLERGLKGSAPGEQLLGRMYKDKVYFDFSQPMNILEDRINDVKNENSNSTKINELSIASRRHIYDLPEQYKTEGKNKPEKISSPRYDYTPEEVQTKANQIEAEENSSGKN